MEIPTLKNQSGKIYWVESDFKFSGGIKEESLNISANITHCYIDENSIRFLIDVHEIDKDDFSYSVTLLRDRDFIYKGKFIRMEDDTQTGEIQCEIFINGKKILLHGSWVENESDYTCWAIVPIQKN